MEEAGGRRDLSVELRDELLQTPSLWECFIDKTVIDAKKWSASKVSNPPWFIFIGMVGATIFLGFLKNYMAILSGIFALGLAIWILFVRNTGSKDTVEKVFDEVKDGVFPVDLKDSIIRRLRWWSVVIVPNEWTKNSKIFGVRTKLIKRLQELESELEYWSSTDGVEKLEKIHEDEEAIKIRQEEYNKKLSLLKSRGVNVREFETGKDEGLPVTERYSDPAVLAKRIRGKAECDRQLMRIHSIVDPIERLQEEVVLVKALLLRCDKIVSMIEEVDGLAISVESITNENLNEKVREMVYILEQRRLLVGKLNRISPKRVLAAVDYDPKLAKLKAENERKKNAEKR